MSARRGSWLLLAALAFGFALELQRHALANPAALYALGALPDSGSLQRQWWRLLAYGFLHWDATHLLANASLLAWVAPAVERRRGAPTLWAVFALAVFASGLGILAKHAWWPSPGVSVGASGGAFALLAYANVLVWRDKQSSRRARIALAAVLVLGLAVSLLPGVSLVGHLIGLVVGLGAAALSREHVQSALTISPVSTLRDIGAASEPQARTPSK